MDSLTLIFKNLLNTCIVSSVMLLLIILVKKVFKNKISANIFYFLFLILLVRLIFPFSIHSKVSIENLYHREEVTQFDETYSDKEIQVDYFAIRKQIYTPVSSRNNEEKLYRFFTYVWLFGIFVVVFFPIISYFTLKRELFKDENAVNDIVEKALSDAAGDLGIIKRFRVVYSYYLDAPALIGVINPIVVLPMSQKGADYGTVYYILLHELIHYKKRHLLFQWIFWIVKAVYWFNPLVWLAHNMMKHEAELACDEEVVKIIGEDNKREYGNLLIDLAENVGKTNYTVNASGLLNKKSELKSRIVRLTKKINRSKAVQYISAVLILIMLPVFFTSYAIYKPEIIEKVIAEDVNAPVLSSDNITFTPKRYEYNTKTGKLSVFLDYEINRDLHEKLIKNSEISLYFALQFPGSIEPQIRNKDYSAAVQSTVKNTNREEISCVFEIGKFDKNQFGKAKLVFEGAQINRKFPQIQEIRIDKNRLPVTEKIDDLFSIEYTQLTSVKEINSLDIKYKVKSPLGIKVSLWDQYFIESKEPFLKASEDRENSAATGKGTVTLSGPANISGVLNDEQWEMTLYFNANTEDVDAVIMQIEAYSVYLGMNRLMHSYEPDKISWRFDINVEDGDIEYER